MYRALLLVCAGLAVAKSHLPPQHFDTADVSLVLKFHQHYDSWLRRRFGCPQADAPAKNQPPLVRTVECWPAAAYIDNDEWRKARELAKDVFQLHD